jgi:hypothetical protein
VANSKRFPLNRNENASGERNKVGFYHSSLSRPFDFIQRLLSQFWIAFS